MSLSWVDAPTFVLYFENNQGYRMHHYHLGTNSKLAHMLAAERFESMNEVGDFVKSVVLRVDGKEVDRFNGSTWTSGYKEF